MGKGKNKTEGKIKIKFSTAVAMAIILILIVLVMGVIIVKNSETDKSQEENTPIEISVATANDIDKQEQEQYVTVLEDGSKLNISEEFSKEKTIDGLELKEIQLKETGGITTLLATVENTTDSKIEETDVKLDILDDQNDVIVTIYGTVPAVESGSSVQLNASATSDLANAYDFRIYK